MKTLDRYFYIFSEGAGDFKLREAAIKLTNAIHKALKNPKKNLFKQAKDQSQVIRTAISVGLLLNQRKLNSLILAFEPVKEIEQIKSGSFKYYEENDMYVIKLYVGVDPETFWNLDNKSWKNMVISNCEKYFLQAKSTFLHELIHFYDTRKIMKKSGIETVKKLSKDSSTTPHDVYFNTPKEYNAYLNQVLIDFQDKASKLNTRQQLQNLIGKNANEFYTKVINSSHKGFKKFATEETKNRIKKRSYMLWNDLMSKFNGGSK